MVDAAWVVNEEITSALIRLGTRGVCVCALTHRAMALVDCRKATTTNLDADDVVAYAFAVASGMTAALGIALARYLVFSRHCAVMDEGRWGEEQCRDAADV